MKAESYFYLEIWGWQKSLVKEPSGLVPTGKLWNKGYPRVVRVGRNGKWYATRLTELPKSNHP